jgi:hypothetical protein
LVWSTPQRPMTIPTDWPITVRLPPFSSAPALMALRVGALETTDIWIEAKSRYRGPQIK